MIVWIFKFCLVFKGSCLKQKNATYTRPNRIIFFIVYELDTWSQDLNSDFTIKDCLFGGVKLAKNADRDEYVYIGYGIGFDSHSEFSLPDNSMSKNLIISGIDMSSFVHINNQKKRILIFGFPPIQELDKTMLTSEAQYSINFSRSNKKFYLSFHYNGSNSLLSVYKNISVQSKRF